MSFGVMSLGEIVGRLSVSCAAEISGNAITIVLDAVGPPRASVIEAEPVKAMQYYNIQVGAARYTKSNLVSYM
jgi:hypothetical protein